MRHLIVFLVLAGSTLARAQDDPPLVESPSDRLDRLEKRLEEQDAEIERLRHEVEDQRAHVGTDPGDPESAEAVEQTPSELLGKVTLLPPTFSSHDGSHKVWLNGRVMADARIGLHSQKFFSDTFQVRRARMTLNAQLYTRIFLRLGLEFGRTSNADVRDAYLHVEFAPEFQMVAGQQLLPFSMERLTSSTRMKHPERPIFVDQIVALRDIGFMIKGDLFEKLLSYEVMVFDGSGQNLKVDTDDDFDGAGRLVLRPLKGLTLDVAYWYSPSNRLRRGPSLPRTVGGQATPFLLYALLTNRHDGNRQRFDAGARYRWGPLEVKGEFLVDYLRGMRRNDGFSRKTNLTNWSAFVDVSWLITGEEQTGKNVVPDSPVWEQDGGFAGGAGAFEINLRYEHLRYDPDTTRKGFATGTDRVHAATATAIWIPIERLRFMASYSYASFEDRVFDRKGDATRNDHVLALRWALHF
jgi:phosphate-selective porin